MPEISALAILGYVCLSLLVFFLVVELWLGHQHTEKGFLVEALLIGAKALLGRRAKTRSALPFTFAI